LGTDPPKKADPAGPGNCQSGAFATVSELLVSRACWDRRCALTPRTPCRSLPSSSPTLPGERCSPACWPDPRWCCWARRVQPVHPPLGGLQGLGGAGAERVRHTTSGRGIDHRRADRGERADPAADRAAATRPSAAPARCQTCTINAAGSRRLRYESLNSRNLEN